MINKKLFGKKLYDLRNKYGLSQSNVAQKLNVSYQAVSKWENGQSYPDIEVLSSLAQLFNVSLDSLLLNNINENLGVIQDSPNEYVITEDKNKLMSILSDTLTKEDSLLAMKMIETGELDINVRLEVDKNTGDNIEIISKKIAASKLKSETLSEFSSTLGQLVIKALNKTDYIIREISPFLICPKCKNDLILKKNEKDDDTYLECKNGHNFRIVDGVIDFGSMEQHGNNWSNMYRSYEDYLKDKTRKVPNEMCNFYDYDKILNILIDKIKKIKPSIILEIGSGLASFAEELIKYIDWPCIFLLNDISHRILKYDKRYFDNYVYNPNVKMAYLACDARNLPLKDNVCNCVTSFGGYENILKNYIDAIKQSYRVLKDNGYCVYEMSYVNGLNNVSTQRWINLLKNSGDRDVPYIIDEIHDKKYWFNLNKDIGFHDCELTEIGEEKPAPNINKFPYNYEILRWTGYGVIVSIK